MGVNKSVCQYVEPFMSNLPPTRRTRKNTWKKECAIYRVYAGSAGIPFRHAYTAPGSRDYLSILCIATSAGRSPVVGMAKVTGFAPGSDGRTTTALSAEKIL